MCKDKHKKELDAGANEQQQKIIDPNGTEWKKIPDLYRIGITIKEFHGFKDVHMDIFRWSGKPPFNPEEYIFESIPKNTHEYDYSKMHIEEHFTIDEIERITEFLKKIENTTIQKPCLCSLPIDGSILPTGGIPVGGATDFYVFSSAKDYPLGELKIAGYYDLRRHEKIDPSKPADYIKVYTAGGMNK